MLFFIFTSFSGCEKVSNELNNKIFPIVDINNQYGCVINYVNMQTDSVYLINSEEEFKKYNTCEGNPQIDFSLKTFLLAFGKTTSGISNISKELSLKNNIYYLNVDIQLNDATVPQGWNIAVITDKIKSSHVILNVNQHF